MRLFKITIYLLLIFFILQVHAAKGIISTRIINGQPSATNTYPWMTSVNNGSCGGALIHSQWVLTAAHCFPDGTSNSNIALNTNNQIPPFESFVAVKRVIIHPNYNPNQATSNNVNDFDIALIELSSPVTTTPVAIITGSSTDLPATTKTTVIGWGTTKINSAGESVNPSNILLQAEQQIVSNSDCNTIYSGDITDNMLCANGLSTTDTSDTCQGDSGGPMVIQSDGKIIQVGITSFGGRDILCGDPTTPGVYTKISRFMSFIQNSIPDLNFATASANISSVTSGIDSNQNNCGASLDNALNLDIQCLVVANSAYKTGLNFDPYLSLWRWNGKIDSSNCSITNTACSSLSENADLSLRQVDYQGIKYRLELMFDPFFSNWYYFSHQQE